MNLHLVVPWLALILCRLATVTSLEAPMKVVPDHVSFPNVSLEQESVLPVAIRVSTVTGTTAMNPTVVTSSPAPVINEVEDLRSYQVASEAVHSVATRLHHLVDPSGRKNYLVSPFSVALLSAQVLLAARGDAERRLRVLLTGSRASTTSSGDGDERITDLELHFQLGGLLKHLRSQGGEKNDSYILEAASVFFTNSEINVKSSYHQTVSHLYGSDFIPLNFSGDPSRSLKEINQWAKVHTNNRIPVIYSSPLPRHTAAVILNSVYFRSAWESPFDPHFTGPGVFRLNTTHQIKAQYLRGVVDTLFVDHKELACRMVVLPYKSADVNMYVVLPNKEVTDMKEFAIKLSTSNITTLIKAAAAYSVTVALPKMTLTATYSLKEPIMKYRPHQVARDDLGPRINVRVNRRNRTSTTTTTTTSPTTTTTTSSRTTTTTTSSPTTKTTTTPSSKTTRGPTLTTTKSSRTTKRPRTTSGPPASKPWFDLSGASNDPNFRINDILHQVSLEVSETGTEAVAVSTTTVDYSGDGKVFKADRPFLFFIRHEPTLVNLFYAVVMDPTNGNYD